MEKETDSRPILAKGYFGQGYNCCQSVVLAFAEDIGLSDEAALRLASAFGGGMGKMREVCGALTGSFMVAGMKKGYTDPDADQDKEALYRLVQELAEAFRQKNGSILCRDLIGEDYAPGDATPGKRTQAYYDSRPCANFIEDAVRLLEEKLN
ncbi:MAG: C_GCAxxG_C_C family protein [Lentisphaerae bacterium]|nr:C_GCAxxG_C_C family protein [Lentisphaerota bacterium]